MKKLFMALTMIAFLVSCGKDNKVDGNSGSYASSITIDNQVGQQIGSYINSNAFGTTQWIQAAAYYPYGSYKHGLSKTTSTNSNGCELKTGWLGIKYYSCTSSSSGQASLDNYNIVKSTAVNVDLETKKGELRGIINSAASNGVYTNDGILYYVKTTSGDMFVIDRRIPVQANPAAHINSSGVTTYYFLGLSMY